MGGTLGHAYLYGGGGAGGEPCEPRRWTAAVWRGGLVVALVTEIEGNCSHYCSHSAKRVRVPYQDGSTRRLSRAEIDELNVRYRGVTRRETLRGGAISFSKLSMELLQVPEFWSPSQISRQRARRGPTTVGAKTSKRSFHDATEQPGPPRRPLSGETIPRDVIPRGKAAIRRAMAHVWCCVLVK